MSVSAVSSHHVPVAYAKPSGEKSAVVAKPSAPPSEAARPSGKALDVDA